KILYVGGGGDLNWSTNDPKASAPTATAETITLGVSGPHWSSTDPMHFARRHLNATILPDGQVLVTGGTSAGGFNTLSGAVHAAEIWDPQTGHWSLLASNSIDRAYHSVSLLLPDGTVLHGASGDASVPLSTQLYPRQANHEIFRPPYLFKGVRPTITGLSKTTVTYGETFTVTTAYAAQITKVRWIRLGSVTHAFDANQRANTLTFSRGSGQVSVTAPSNARRAPPGHYLLFLLNRNGVPSAGRIMRVQ
ncbi:MAG TPA: galactose oxidase early set domain-containing protein, partial [Chloroflexota bacterium]